MPGKTFTEPGIVLRQIKEELESDNPSKCVYKYQLYYIDYTRRNEKGMLISDKWMDPKALMKQGIETANEGRVSIKLGDKIRFQHDAANMIHIILPVQEMTKKQTFGNRREIYYNSTFNGVENPRFKYGSHIYVIFYCLLFYCFILTLVLKAEKSEGGINLGPQNSSS